MLTDPQIHSAARQALPSSATEKDMPFGLGDFGTKGMDDFFLVATAPHGLHRPSHVPIVCCVDVGSDSSL
jgi:hypothetical protein